jgi:hypothetical protein
MATRQAIADGIQMLIDARMSYIPKAVEKTAELWDRVFQNIPDEIFSQAVMDYAATETDWPQPVKLRKLAEQVKIHNGTSASADAFADLTEPKTTWLPSKSQSLVVFPAWIEKEIAELEAKYYQDGLPTDAELARIRAITAPYMRDNHARLEVQPCTP